MADPTIPTAEIPTAEEVELVKKIELAKEVSNESTESSLEESTYARYKKIIKDEFEKRRKQALTFLLISFFQLIFCILILASSTPPRGSIPMTHSAKEDIQLTLNQTNWLKGKVWNNESDVSQGYADVHDFFMTLPSGSCSQLSDANDLEGEVTEFTKAIGTYAQNFVKVSNINYYNLEEKEVETGIFNKMIDGTAVAADFQQVGNCETDCVTIYDFRGINKDKYKSCLKNDFNSGDGGIVTAECKVNQRCIHKNNEDIVSSNRTCMRNEYCKVASRSAADICVPGLYYDYCVAAGGDDGNFISFDYREMRDNSFYSMVGFASIFFITFNALILLLFLFFAVEKPSGERKCLSSITKCFARINCCCKKEEDSEITNREKIALKKYIIQEKDKLGKFYNVDALEDKIKNSKTNEDLTRIRKEYLPEEPVKKNPEEPAGKNSKPPEDFILYHDIELNFDPAAAEEAGTEVTEEEKKEARGLLFYLTVGLFAIMVLMQLFCVVLYFISYVYLTEIGNGITFEPNSYHGNGTFHNIHPNISPVLTAFFTPALLLITAVIQCFLIIAEGIISFSIYRSKKEAVEEAEEEVVNGEMAELYRQKFELRF